MRNNFNKNLRFLRKKKNLTQDDLAKRIDRDYTTIGKWETGDRTPKLEEVLKLANFFGVSPYDLISEDLSMQNAKETKEIEDIISIPVYGTIKAGIPIESQSDIIDYIDIPRSWTKGGREFYGLKISGDSMYPKYLENDYVVFEKTEDIALYNNKDVAVRINHTESTFTIIVIKLMFLK